jgi:hypothetical protein
LICGRVWECQSAPLKGPRLRTCRCLRDCGRPDSLPVRGKEAMLSAAILSLGKERRNIAALIGINEYAVVQDGGGSVCPRTTERKGLPHRPCRSPQSGRSSRVHNLQAPSRRGLRQPIRTPVQCLCHPRIHLRTTDHRYTLRPHRGRWRRALKSSTSPTGARRRTHSRVWPPPHCSSRCWSWFRDSDPWVRSLGRPRIAPGCTLRIPCPSSPPGVPEPEQRPLPTAVPESRLALRRRASVSSLAGLLALHPKSATTLLPVRQISEALSIRVSICGTPGHATTVMQHRTRRPTG